MSQIRQTELMETRLGNLGSKEITGTSAVLPETGKVFTFIHFVAASVVTTQTDSGITNADLSALTSIPVGTTVYGKWSSITLTSGEAIGYFGT